ncbi:hypothetical protein Taro_033658 [Colocasia esculenta]|uniref:DUF3741 domain-containing protein n=1 Tax=Colocasia esculenta TaxID=4460 RepID=A0A843VPB3_COLES|nr:hypothetical protein [Colocasia esculenta]
MLASSSRRETAGTTEKSRQAKKVGCMSGIFYFLHFHRHHSRKRLPSPGKRDSKTIVSPPPAPALSPQPEPKPTAAAEPGQKTPHKKRAARQQVMTSPSVAAKSPGDKSTNSKRSAPHEAAPAAAATELGGKTSHNKRAAPDVAAKFGEKTSHNKRAAAPEAAAAPPAAGGSPGGGLSRRLSCDVPRSPTLPSEIRRSNSSGNAARNPPALVARLMGLDDPPPPVDTPDSAAEKRRKLLGALERCDEDLRALKNIIEALHIAESSQKASTASLVVDRGDPATPKRSDSGHAGAVEDKRCLDVDGEQPSPVSVLDALSSPPARRRSNINGSATMAKGGRHDKEARVVDGQSPLFHRNANAASGRRAERPFLEYYSSEPWQRTGTTSHPWQRLPCSRAMEESVEQVWEDGVLEERWELGKVGVGLEADILGDLVAEVVKELGFRRCSRLPLPFDACRKRLCY